MDRKMLSPVKGQVEKVGIYSKGLIAGGEEQSWGRGPFRREVGAGEVERRLLVAGTWRGRRRRRRHTY